MAKATTKAKRVTKPKKAVRKRSTRSAAQDQPIYGLLLRHFSRRGIDSLRIAERKFPFRVRPDLHRAIETVFGDKAVTLHRFCGVRKPYAYEGIDFGCLLVAQDDRPAVVVPPHYEEVDVGEEQPVRCLDTGLWLLEQKKSRYAVLLTPDRKHGETVGVRFQIATSDDATGEHLADAFFRSLESAVSGARSYRGKVLSLEQESSYTGRSTGIKVHRLRGVPREQVILPEKTLALLDRNVIGFVQRRQRLSALGQATKKGLLFYGPPGTGKSHTIHYLAGALKGHTTLLITAEQVALLDEYVALGRLLQPSVMVIEDVDLIARDRDQMYGPCDESLLNKLLNEMDGLRENADILFILTTNRPEALEAALASRPGRVDQAIEFPLPDDEGRRKLVRLYADRVPMTDEVVQTIVKRTQNVSAAFIKELMRRSVQFLLERDGDGAGGIEIADVENALSEMLFVGGSLNAKLLGAGTGATSQGGVAE